MSVLIAIFASPFSCSVIEYPSFDLSKIDKNINSTCSSINGILYDKVNLLLVPMLYKMKGGTLNILFSL